MSSQVLWHLVAIVWVTQWCASCHEANEPVMKSVFKLTSGWEFRGVDTLNSWRPATVPGTIHTDLLANGLIQDPYYRTNEKGQQWIDKHDWMYRTTFDVSEELLAQSHIFLDFEGLDTYATVSLNDQEILTADNFFRSWHVDVKALLKASRNELRIAFDSPIKVGLEALEAHGYGLPASNDQSENGGLGDKRVSVFTRKPGYHYGWDWGPRFVTSGIWKDVFLSGWSELTIADVYYNQQMVTDSLAKLQVEVAVDSDLSETITLNIFADDVLLAEQSVLLTKGSNHLQIPLEMTDPQLWWTYDLGTPKLYNFKLQLVRNGSLLAQDQRPIGLRSIEVVREQDTTGRSFYFKLNGTSIFAKGANYIPNDMFLPRVTDDRYEGVIQAALEANMNMLRVWGGGIYEKDVFYNLCDEKGILVWQDFMFACSMYPGDSSFLSNVKKEAEENVMRLRNHPSIALWCGNNEMDVAWDQWGWKQDYTESQQMEIQADYDRVFHDILPEVVGELHSSVFYWPSSPYNGQGSHATSETKSGDVHYWGVWHGEHSFESFKDYVGRFMSEYGFQSFPDFETVKAFTEPADWDIESEVMAAHQRSGIGNLRIKSYMDQYYRLPKTFEDILYLGQVLQAEGMRYGMETHRRAMPYCMGSLYWQINDCWPVASWSGMDYYQKWKGLHYFTKKAFAPVLISPYQEGHLLKIQLVNDLTKPISGVLNVDVMDFDGNVVRNVREQIAVDPQTSSEIFVREIADVLVEASSKEHLLRARLFDEMGQSIAENIFYFEKVKDLLLPSVEVKSTLRKKSDLWEVSLQANHLAKNVFVNFPGLKGHFSDNYFDLIPGEIKVLTYDPQGGSEPREELIQLKTVKSTY